METNESVNDVPFIESWHFRSLLLTAICGVLGYFLFVMWNGWREVLAAVQTFGMKGVSICAAMTVLNLSFRFLRWHNFLNQLGYQIPWVKSLRIYLSGFALSTTPGKTGEALRSVFLKKYHVSYRHSIGAFFAERISDLSMALLLSSLGLWYYEKGRVIAIIIFIYLALVFILIQKASWIHAIGDFAKRNLPEKFGSGIHFITDFILAFKQCFNFYSMIYSLMLGLGAFLVEGFAFYTLVKLGHFDISFSWALFIYCFSLIIGAVSFIPGGLGTTEFTMWQLLVLEGVTSSYATAVTIMIRLTTIWFGVLIGILCLPKFTFTKEAKDKTP